LDALPILVGEKGSWSVHSVNPARRARAAPAAPTVSRPRRLAERPATERAHRWSWATESTTTTAVGGNQVEAAGAGTTGPPRAWRTWAAVGRLTGSRSRHAAARGRKDSGTPLRSGPTLSARNSTEEGCPSPKGPVPVRA